MYTVHPLIPVYTSHIIHLYCVFSVFVFTPASYILEVSSVLLVLFNMKFAISLVPLKLNETDLIRARILRRRNLVRVL